MRASLRQRSGFWLAAMLAALACASSARVAAAQELELPVPRAIIYPGDVLSDDKLEQRAFVARTVARSTIHEARDGLVGKFAKRTLLPGQPIPINAVRDPWLATQGKTAMVVFEWGGLVITTNALALQNGGLGDVVSLRNIDSGAVIRGTVASDGSVRLEPQ